MTKGGGWLLEPTDADSVMTPERLTDEHRLIGQTTEQFVVQEVVPQLEKLEQHDWAVARRLIHKCAELGLLGIDVAEECGVNPTVCAAATGGIGARRSAAHLSAVLARRLAPAGRGSWRGHSQGRARCRREPSRQQADGVKC
jgi:alkylation response protein AidB-like acyl-CoA dehydrogenase